MSKQCVLISIRPQYCELIASDKKTIEVRKTRPKLETPFKCYIYCTIGAPYLNRHNGYLYLEERDTLGGRGHGIYDRLNRKVIGEFVCDSVMDFFGDSRFWLDEKAVEQSCLTGDQIREYANGKESVYGWHISALQIYDKPRELSEFKRKIMGETWEYPQKVTRPPQSWCYVEELK